MIELTLMVNRGVFIDHSYCNENGKHDTCQLQPILLGASVLATLWLILLWLHQRKIYLRI